MMEMTNQTQEAILKIKNQLSKSKQDQAPSK